MSAVIISHDIHISFWLHKNIQQNSHNERINRGFLKFRIYDLKPLHVFTPENVFVIKKNIHKNLNEFRMGTGDGKKVFELYCRFFNLGVYCLFKETYGFYLKKKVYFI